MQDKRIDQLPRSEQLHDADLFAISRGGITNSISFATLFKPVYDYIKALIKSGRTGDIIMFGSNEPAVESGNGMMFNVRMEELNQLNMLDSGDLLMVFDGSKAHRVSVGNVHLFLTRYADQVYRDIYTRDSTE